MRWFEVLGYIGSVLMFSTFYMKTMIPLRLVGIAANVFMIGYTAFAHAIPILILQSCLLPLNIVRLVQMKRMVNRVNDASRKDFNLDPLLPFMRFEQYPKGHLLFERGDASDKLFVIQRGSIRLVEWGHVSRKGDMLGEIGLLSASNQRTATAVCEEDTDVLSLTRAQVFQLYYQDPKFSFYLVRMIIERLLHNLEAHGAATTRETMV